MPRRKFKHSMLAGEILPTRAFAEIITPERAMELHNSIKSNPQTTLQYWQKQAKINKLCPVCRAEPIWRWGQSDMCFSCTTGESDPSDDYEIEYQPEGKK